VAEEHPINGDWLNAFWHAQETGDLTELAKYLRQGGQIGAGEITTLISLCERHRLNRKRGAGPPLFKLSAEQRLKIAARKVRALQQRAKGRGEKLPLNDAIVKFVRRHPWDEALSSKDQIGGKLSNFMAGKRGSSRR
jgi:hypothetical protein